MWNHPEHEAIGRNPEHNWMYLLLMTFNLWKKILQKFMLHSLTILYRMKLLKNVKNIKYQNVYYWQAIFFTWGLVRWAMLTSNVSILIYIYFSTHVTCAVLWLESFEVSVFCCSFQGWFLMIFKDFWMKFNNFSGRKTFQGVFKESRRSYAHVPP